MPTVSASRRVHAPIDDVWAVLSDLKNAQRWNSAWENIELEGEGIVGEGVVFLVRGEDGLSNDHALARITHLREGIWGGVTDLIQRAAMS